MQILSVPVLLQSHEYCIQIQRKHHQQQHFQIASRPTYKNILHCKTTQVFQQHILADEHR
jgi:hypothetical protein